MEMKNIYVLSVLFACSLGSATHLSAASFDCSKASSTNEKLICANKNLSQLDEQYSELYRQARKDPALKNLKRDARAFLKRLNETFRSG